MKEVKDISYTASNENRKDSVIGKNIPFYVQTFNLKKDNPSYNDALSSIENLVFMHDYHNIYTHRETDLKADVYNFDKKIDSEWIVFLRGEDELTFVSISAKNLTKEQKDYIKSQSIKIQ